MATLILTIATTTELLPSGKSFSQYLYTIYNADGSIYTSGTNPATSATFSGVPVGIYSATVCAVDGSSNPISAPVACPFTVTYEPGDTGTYQAPAGLSAELS